jgi:ribosome-binding factor A
MSYDRIDRISEEVKRELSSLIRELKDPRIPNLVTIVAVSITKDLRFAKVFISVFGTDEQQTNCIAGLNSASGFIRREIGKRVQLRYSPEFSFVLDHSIEYGAHINGILQDMNLPKDDDK